MKKLFISFIAMLSVVFFFVSGKGYAEEVNTVQNIDQYIIVENNQFYLNIPKELENSFTEQVKEVLEERNEYIKKNDLIINPVTKKITDKFYHYRFFSINEDTEYYWWGMRHIFYSDWDAKQYAHEMRNAAFLISAGTSVTAALGPLAAGVTGLTSAVVGLIAESVDYNADLDGDGVILDLNWWATFACYPR